MPEGKMGKNTIFINNSWLILTAGCLIQTVLGGIYAWSTFIPYLNNQTYKKGVINNGKKMFSCYCHGQRI